MQREYNKLQTEQIANPSVVNGKVLKKLVKKYLLKYFLSVIIANRIF